MEKQTEAVTNNHLPIIHLAFCDRCGACISGCPENSLVMTDQGPQFKQPITCTYCTKCEAICHTHAIRAPLTVSWGHDQK